MVRHVLVVVVRVEGFESVKTKSGFALAHHQKDQGFALQVTTEISRLFYAMVTV